MDRNVAVLGWMIAAAIVAGCAADKPMPDTPVTTGHAAPPSLYKRLGKKEAITAVVDDFVTRVANDPRINGKFAGANIPRLKALLVEQICAATGGPCVYTGRDMKTAHKGMGISESDWTVASGRSILIRRAESTWKARTTRCWTCLLRRVRMVASLWPRSCGQRCFSMAMPSSPPRSSWHYQQKRSNQHEQTDD